MKNLLLLFIVSIFFFGFVFTTNASEQLPKNISAFNKYLSDVDTNERVITYTEIIDNIDTLVKEVNESKTISKGQKRKLLSQYRLYKSRTQLALRKEQKKSSVNIDLQRIISRKNTSSGTNISTNTGSTNSILIYQKPSPQYEQNTPTNTNTSPQVNNKTNPIVTISNNSSQSGNTIGNPSIVPITKNNTVTFSSYGPNNIVIAGNNSDMLGSFSIQSGDDSVYIKKLVFKNVGTAKLRDLIIGGTRVWNYDQSQQVSSTDIVQDDTLYMVGMSLHIPKNKKLSYNIRSEIGPILGFLGKSVQLTLVPEESEIYIEDSNGISSRLGSENLINSINFQIAGVTGGAPSINMNRKSTSIALISFENGNKEFDIQIESFKLDILSSQYGSKLNGMACFRPEQSTVSCKDSGAFMPRVIEDSSSTYYLQVTPTAFSSSNTISKIGGDGNKARYELFLDGIYLDEAPRIIVSEIVYKAGGHTFKVSANSAGNLENPIILN